jgi:hypothetical protein
MPAGAEEQIFVSRCGQVEAAKCRGKMGLVDEVDFPSWEVSNRCNGRQVCTVESGGCTGEG